LLQQQKRKDFLHRIVIGDEKWIGYNNPKQKKSWGNPFINIQGKAEYPWLQAYALYLLRLAGYRVLRATPN